MQTATAQLTLFGVSAEPQTSRRPVVLVHSTSATPRTAKNGKAIVGTYNPSRRCDSRCMGAVSHICNCSCGGKNHGIWS